MLDSDKKQNQEETGQGKRQGHSCRTVIRNRTRKKLDKESDRTLMSDSDKKQNQATRTLMSDSDKKQNQEEMGQGKRQGHLQGADIMRNGTRKVTSKLKRNRTRKKGHGQ